MASTQYISTKSKSIVLILFLFSFLSKSYSADNPYTITIIDSETKAPIENVHFYINNKPFLSSDKNGLIRIEENLLTKPQDSFRFTCIGYQEKIVTFSELKENDFRVMLDKESVQIDNAVVYGRKLKHSLHFESLANLPKAVHSFGSAICNDTIYVVGGAVTNSTGEEFYLGDLYKYSLKDDKWTKSEHTFKKRIGHAVHIFGDKMYIIGGMTALPNRNRQFLDNVIEVFDLKTEETILDPINPHIAFNFLSALKDSLIVVIGGSQQILQNGTKTYIKENHLFDLKTGIWYKIGALDEGKEVKGVWVDDKVYLIGGHSFRPLDLIECYDMTTGKTTVELTLPQNMARPAICTDGHFIYIFNKNRIYRYNTVSKDLSEYLIDLDVEEAELYYHDNKLYILGGKATVLRKLNLPESMEVDVLEATPYFFCVDIDEFGSTQSIN